VSDRQQVIVNIFHYFLVIHAGELVVRALSGRLPDWDPILRVVGEAA
jgi:hypothetical protein